MDLELTGRCAVVTGGSRGIGRAVARGLSMEGCRLVIGSRDQGALEAAAKEISSETGHPVSAATVDLNDKKSTEEFAVRALTLVPQIDIFVHCVGSPPFSPRQELVDEDWSESFERAFQSARRLTEAVLPAMRSRQWGRLLYVLSATVRQPGFMVTNAQHGALAVYVKALANEIGRDNVLANSVSPGFVATGRLDHLAERYAALNGKRTEAVLEDWMAGVPLARPARVEEVADLVVFLASRRASYLTGRCFDIDGGLVKGLL